MHRWLDAMAIVRSREGSKENGHRVDRHASGHDGHLGVVGDVTSGDGHAPGEHALHGLAIDGLALPARGIAHGAVSDAVDVA